MYQEVILIALKQIQISICYCRFSDYCQYCRPLHF